MPRIPFGIAYLKKNSVLHRVSILDKVVLIVVVAFLSLFMGPIMHMVVLYVLLLIFAFLLSGPSIRTLIWPQVLLIVFFLPLSVFIALIVPFEGGIIGTASDYIYVNILGFVLILSKSGLGFALIMSFRGLLISVPTLMLVWTSHPRDLVYTLTEKARVPYKLSWAAFLGMIYTPIIGYESQVVDYAQQIRGMKINKWNPFSRTFLSKYILPIMIRGLRRGITTATAMDSRGFGAFGDRTFRYTPTSSKYSHIFSVVCIVLTALYVVLFFNSMYWDVSNIFRPVF